jgi:hypothetical protein
MLRKALLLSGALLALCTPSVHAAPPRYGCFVSSYMVGEGKFESVQVDIFATKVPARGALYVYVYGTPAEDGLHATLSRAGESDTVFASSESPVSVTVLDPQLNTVCQAALRGK